MQDRRSIGLFDRLVVLVLRFELDLSMHAVLSCHGYHVHDLPFVFFGTSQRCYS